MKVFVYSLLMVAVLFLLACREEKTQQLAKAASKPDNKDAVKPEEFFVLQKKPDSLYTGEYLQWIKNQHGLTFSSIENEEIMFSLIFKPLQLEAALSLEGIASPELLHQKNEVKKDYLYFEIDYLDKFISVNKEKDRKDKLVQAIRQSVFVETESGVVYNSILEFFPPVMMNQPGKALLLVPAIAFDSWIKVTIAGKKFSLPDISLNISQEALKEFPKIKI